MSQDESGFRQEVDRTLKALLQQIDELDPDRVDARLAAGSLTVQFEGGGTFVLSQQTPTRELWLSANLRAWHFDKRDGAWRERDSREDMLQVLDRLFSGALATDVHFHV